jgi:sRNA-binding carbon storage regulator CsrA
MFKCVDVCELMIEFEIFKISIFAPKSAMTRGDGEARRCGATVRVGISISISIATVLGLDVKIYF